MRTRAWLSLVALAAACHDPNSEKHRSLQAQGTPPLPPEPASTTEITRSNPGQDYERFLDAAVPNHDGAAACSVVIERSAQAGPDYVVQNTGNVDLRSCNFVFYAYDRDGKQLERVEVAPFVFMKKGEVLHPAQAIRGLVGGARAAELEERGDVMWEAVVMKVVFADGATWNEPGRAPGQKPQGRMP
jgi:hypothetical protein